MLPDDETLKIAIDRQAKKAVLKHHDKYHLPVDAHHKADSIVAALLAAERKTGIRFDDTITLATGDHRVSITSDESVQSDLDALRPKLRMSVKFITGKEAWSKEELESIFLHEIAHQHYTALRKKFEQENDVSDLIREVAILSTAIVQNTEETTARIVKHYGTVDRFFQDLEGVTDFLKKRYGAIDHEPLRHASDAQMAHWLKIEHGNIVAPNARISTPLSAYAALPELPEEVYHIIDRFRGCLSKEIEPEDIDKAKSFIGTIDNAPIGQLSHLLHDRVLLPKQLKRGEELLCDDFAVLHSDDPFTFIKVMRRLAAREVPSEHPQTDSHPSCNDRITRIYGMAKRVEAGRESRAVAGEAGSYGSWVERLAAEEMPEMPAATLTVRSRPRRPY